MNFVFFGPSRVNELRDNGLLDILNALHGNLLNIGCCNRKLFRIARSLLAHFRCRVCQTAGLRLRAFPRDQRKFRLFSKTNTSQVYPWRCYRCGVRQEAETINRRRLRMYDRKCAVCCDFLHASPPPYSYMQNCSRRRNMLYRCSRCLHGAPPSFSLALRGICLDWENMLHDSPQSLYDGGDCSGVLFLVIKTLTEETRPYRCTWKTGVGCRYDAHGEIVPLDLRGIIIFLGEKFTRPYSRREHGIMTSDFIRDPDWTTQRRKIKWVLTGFNQVVHRTCCHPDSTGYFCNVCSHQH
jgi:hypothetical protein